VVRDYTLKQVFDYSSIMMPWPATFLTTTEAIVNKRGPKVCLTDIGKTIICNSRVGARRGRGLPGPSSPPMSAALYGMHLQLVVYRIFVTGGELQRRCRLSNASIQHCIENGIYSLNLCDDLSSGQRLHDGQLCSKSGRGMEAFYNVQWFECPGCQQRPTSLGKSLMPQHWECDGLDRQTGRTTHNDNKRKRSYQAPACAMAADFLNELRAGNMHPRCVPCHRIKSNQEQAALYASRKTARLESAGKLRTTNTMFSYFSKKTTTN
jgi:hypothetical protein